jgi:hypothetical protein
MEFSQLISERMWHRRRLPEADDKGPGRGGWAGGTGERVAREPLTGRVTSAWFQVVGSGPVGERATPTPGQDPLSLPL